MNVYINRTNDKTMAIHQGPYDGRYITENARSKEAKCLTNAPAKLAVNTEYKKNGGKSDNNRYDTNCHLKPIIKYRCPRTHDHRFIHR